MRMSFGLVLLMALSGKPAYASSNWLPLEKNDLSLDHNPWWLFNTPTVHFCIQVDPRTASVSPEKVESYLRKAWDYWYRQTDRETNTRLTPLATQKLERSVCADDNQHIDLRIQFGEGALDPNQKAFIKSENSSYESAATVRTDYDRVTLRGRGFIYFPSDLPPAPKESLRAWSEDRILYRALIHQVGLILGLKAYPTWTVMAEGATRAWFSRKLRPNSDEPLPIYKLPLSIHGCHPAAFKFATLDVPYPCYRIEEDPFLKKTLNVTTESSNGKRDGAFVGTITFDGISWLRVGLAGAALPPEQKVFQDRHEVVGANIRQQSWELMHGVFKGRDGMEIMFTSNETASESYNFIGNKSGCAPSDCAVETIFHDWPVAGDMY